MSNSRHQFRGPLTAIALLVLTGCVDPASVTLGGASVVTAADTGKTVSDHAMSYLTGEECTILHTLKGIA